MSRRSKMAKLGIGHDGRKSGVAMAMKSDGAMSASGADELNSNLSVHCDRNRRKSEDSNMTLHNHGEAGVSANASNTLRKRNSKVTFMTNLSRIMEKSESQELVDLDDRNNLQDKDWQNEKGLTSSDDVFDRTPSPTDSDFSSISSPFTPHSLHFSLMSMDSCDEADENDNKVFETSASYDPDVMAAGNTRRGTARSRRSGFAFRFGDQEVPANAFLNTETDDKSPKMLSVAEMMMKIHSDSKSLDVVDSHASGKDSSHGNSPNGGGSSPLSKLEEDSLKKRVAAKGQRFSLIGIRQMSSKEIEEDLNFLDGNWDPSLNLAWFEKTTLLWYDRRGRMLAGVIMGVMLAMVLRLILTVYNIVFGR